jgi:hypothetical protein
VPRIIKFNADETRFLLFGRDTGVMLFEPGPDGVKLKLHHNGSGIVLDIDLTADGGLVAYSTQGGTVHVQRLGKYGVEDRWQLNGHANEPVHAITFSEDGRYLHTESGSFRRRWHADNDARRRYMMLARLPEHDALEDVATVGDQERMNFFVKRSDTESIHEYVNASGKIIAEFPAEESPFSESSTNKWRSPEGRYYATRNGLFNNKGERLVTFNETRYAYKWDIYEIGFSSDGKYFFMIDRLLFLDAETILARLNDDSLFGQLAHLEPREREQYMIR